MQYKLIENSDIVERKNDEGIISCIPNDPSNKDWNAYQDWLDNGNTPLASDADWS